MRIPCQTLHKMLKIEPYNLTRSIRKRDLLIRLEKWSEAPKSTPVAEGQLPEPERGPRHMLLTDARMGGSPTDRPGHPERHGVLPRPLIKTGRSCRPTSALAKS